MERVPWTFDRTGSHRALDLANTVSGRLTDRPTDHLSEWQRVIDFAEQTGLVPESEVASWRALQGADPVEAETSLAAVRRLRDALYGVFLAVVEDRPPPAESLAMLNRWIGHMALGPDFEWRCVDAPEAHEAVFMPLVREAVALLTSPERHRVKECGADDCAWLFLDTSKNGSRRWCDMKQCGNRAKARRFHAKHN